MANEPRKPFSSPAPLPLPTPPGSKPPAKASEGGGPALPLWSAKSGDKLAEMPLFRGAGQKSNSLLGRLKSLKTKDVAFIGAGLAVLVMAPLAEYLISEGDDPDGTLTQGFAQNGVPFPGGSDPSETGIMGLARGGVPGDTSDVITPLNARDPSSLIMGGTGEQKEPPAAAVAEPKRDAPKDSVWDKVVSSAKSGAAAATRKVSLPKPGGKLAGAINGLRSLSGGSTGASLKLAAPDSKGLFSAPKNESHLAATQSVPGYRGAGSRVIAGGSGGNFDGRRGGGFGGPGGGVAGDVMSGGIAGGGGRGTGFSGGDGDPTKNPGGNSTKDAKTLGESLAFLRQKMEMEKAIDLKWAKKRYDQLERKKMIEQTLVQTAQQAFLKVLDKLLEGKKDGGGGGGGGSPGGGGGGEKPPGGPQTPPGSPAGTPSGTAPGGLGSVRSVAAAPKHDGARSQIQAANTTNDDSGSSLGELGGNSGVLRSKAATLAASADPRLQSLAKPLGDAAADIDAAKKQLQADLEAAKKPLGDHEKIRAAVETKLADLKAAGELGKTASASAKEQPGKLTVSGENYVNNGADVSQAVAKSDEGKAKAEAAQHQYQAAQPPEEGKGSGDAAANIERRIAAVEQALALDPGAKVDPAIQASLAQAKAELAGILRQAAQNVRVAEKNVKSAYDAAMESAFRVNQAQQGYAAAQYAAGRNIGEVKTAAEQLKPLIPKWKGKVKDNPGLEGEKSTASAAIDAADGKIQTVTADIAKVEKKVKG